MSLSLKILERDPWHPDEKDLRRRERLRQKLVEKWGIPLPPWEPESTAPPVDLGLLEALRRRELDTQTEREVIMRIWRFQSWSAADCKMALEEYLRKKKQGGQ